MPGPCETGGLCRADNNYHEYYFAGNTTYDFRVANQALVNLDNHTDFTTARVFDAEFVPGQTDLYITTWAAFTGTTTLGQAVCVTVATADICSAYHIRIRPDVSNDADIQFARAKALICHESGHSIGLVHGQDADPGVSSTATSLECMKTPLDPGSRILGEHNVDQINANY